MFHLQPSSYVHPSLTGGRDGWTNGHVVDSGVPRCFKKGWGGGGANRTEGHHGGVALTT